MIAIHPQAQGGRSSWQIVLFGVLIFWLSSCLLIDGIVMPSMYVSGMMEQAGFATAGYSLFWVFNRVELVCAGLILTVVLSLAYLRHPWNRPGAVATLLAVGLLAIAMIDTYGLSPQMGALGLQLNWLSAQVPVVAEMNRLHLEYWGLDLLKMAIVGTLLWRYLRPSFPVSQM